MYGVKNKVVYELNNVEVSLDKRKTQTNTNGDASMILVENKVHTLNLLCKGYKNKSYKVDLSKTLLITDTLEFTTYDFKTVVKDIDTGEIIPDAEVTLNENTVLTNSQGVASFSDIEYNTYALSVIAIDYKASEVQQIEISENSEITIFLSKNYMPVNIKAFEIGTHNPITRAYVKTATGTKSTDRTGMVSLDNLLIGDIVDFNVKKAGYHDYNGSFTVEGATQIDIEMIKTKVQVNVSVSQGTNPLKNVMVNFNGATNYTDSNGNALFSNINTKKSHPLVINQPGFQAIDKTYYIDRDLNISIDLNPSTSINKTGNTLSKIYPNPAKNNLFVDIDKDKATLKIFTIDGKAIKEVLIFKGNNKIDINDIKAGIYLIKIISTDNSSTQQIIIQ